MLLEKIHVHNRLNGYWFSAVEFGVLALVATPFALYYWAVGRWALAVIATGILANSVPPTISAVRSLSAHQSALGWRGLRDPAIRSQIRSEQPHLFADTITITVCTLVPFLAVVLVLVDLAIRPAARGAGSRT